MMSHNTLKRAVKDLIYLDCSKVCDRFPYQGVFTILGACGLKM